MLQKNLKEFKLHFHAEIDFGIKTSVQDIDVPNITSGKEIDFPIKMSQIGLSDFRSFLNIGMLLTESEKAKQLRSMILDNIVASYS